MMEPGPDFVLRGHRDSVNTLCFLNEDVLVSGCGDGQLRIWDLESRLTEQELKASDSAAVLSLSYLQERDLIVSCARDGMVKLWRRGRSEVISSLYCGVGHFCNATTDYSQRDSNIVISPSSEESQMIIWDIRITGNCNEKGLGCKAAGYIDTDKKRGMLTALHYNTGGDNIHLPCDEKCDNCNYSHFENDSCTNDDHIFNDNKNDHANSKEDIFPSRGDVVAGFESGHVAFFDLRTKRLLNEVKDHDEPVMTVHSLTTTNSNTVNLMTSGGASNQVVLHKDVRYSNQEVNSNSKNTISTAVVRKPGTGIARLRHDGKILVSGHWDHSVRIFSTKKLKPLAIMRHHSDSVYAVDFSPRGKFATGSKDCSIAVWSVYSNQSSDEVH